MCLLLYLYQWISDALGHFRPLKAVLLLGFSGIPNSSPLLREIILLPSSALVASEHPDI